MSLIYIFHLALKYGEDGCRGVAGLKLGYEGIREEVSFGFLFVIFQGCVED